MIEILQKAFGKDIYSTIMAASCIALAYMYNNDRQDYLTCEARNQELQETINKMNESERQRMAVIEAEIRMRYWAIDSTMAVTITQIKNNKKQK